MEPSVEPPRNLQNSPRRCQIRNQREQRRRTLDRRVRCVTTAIAILHQLAHNEFAVCPVCDRYVINSAHPRRMRTRPRL
eukprot:15444197-Alexandrium_andersonii.AAC.1